MTLLVTGKTRIFLSDFQHCQRTGVPLHQRLIEKSRHVFQQRRFSILVEVQIVTLK